jgi:hypothetical protein
MRQMLSPQFPSVSTAEKKIRLIIKDAERVKQNNATTQKAELDESADSEFGFH